MITFETTSTSAAIGQVGTTLISLTGSSGDYNYGATTSKVKDSTGGETHITTYSPWNSIFVATFFSGTEEEIVGEGTDTSISTITTSSTGYNNAEVTWRWFPGFQALDFAYGTTSHIDAFGTSESIKYVTAINDPGDEFITDLGTRLDTTVYPATTTTATTLKDWSLSTVSYLGKSTTDQTLSDSYWSFSDSSYYTTSRQLTTKGTTNTTLFQQVTTTTGAPTTLAGNEIVVTATTSGANAALATRTTVSGLSSNQTQTSYAELDQAQSVLLPAPPTWMSTIYGPMVFAVQPVLTFSVDEITLTGGFLGDTITYTRLDTNESSGTITYASTATTTAAGAKLTTVDQIPIVTSGTIIEQASEIATHSQSTTFTATALALSKTSYETTVAVATTTSFGPAETTTFSTQTTTAETLILEEALTAPFPLGEEYTNPGYLPAGFEFATTNTVSFGVNLDNDEVWTHDVTFGMTRASTWYATQTGFVSTIAPLTLTLMNPIAAGVAGDAVAAEGESFNPVQAIQAATIKTLRFDHIGAQKAVPVTGRGANSTARFAYKGSTITVTEGTDSNTQAWAAGGQTFEYYKNPQDKLSPNAGVTLASIPSVLLVGGAGDAFLPAGVYTNSATASTVSYVAGNRVLTCDDFAPVTAWRAIPYWTTSSSAETTSSFESLWRRTEQPLDEA
jgi:hypothetical protein